MTNNKKTQNDPAAEEDEEGLPNSCGFDFEALYMPSVEKTSIHNDPKLLEKYEMFADEFVKVRIEQYTIIIDIQNAKKNKLSKNDLSDLKCKNEAYQMRLLNCIRELYSII